MLEMMRRRRGAALDDAVKVLDEIAMDAQNVRGGAGRKGSVLDDYVKWVPDSERKLVRYFVRADVESFLYTPRYWDARRYSIAPEQLIAALNGELAARVADLLEVRECLSRQHERYGALVSPVLVPDTNAFVHYTFFTEAAWPELANASNIHMVVPLVVVEELDRLKFSRDSKVADRARKVIRALDRLLASGAVRAELPGRGSIEVMSEEPDHDRLPTVDSEIVHVCEELDDLAPASVSVVTGDLGMKVRARSLDVRVLNIPDEWRLTSPGTADG